MPSVQRYSELVLDRWVKIALHVVHGLRNQAKTQFAISVEIVQKTFILLVSSHSVIRGKLTMGLLRSIRQRRMSWVCVACYTQILPLVDVVMRVMCEIRRVIRVACQSSDY